MWYPLALQSHVAICDRYWQIDFVLFFDTDHPVSAKNIVFLISKFINKRNVHIFVWEIRPKFWTAHFADEMSSISDLYDLQTTCRSCLRQKTDLFPLDEYPNDNFVSDLSTENPLTTGELMMACTKVKVKLWCRREEGVPEIFQIFTLFPHRLRPKMDCRQMCACNA